MTVPFRILVTSAGTSTAQGVFKGLLDSNRFEIHTCDINPLHILPIGAFPIASHSVSPLGRDRDKFNEFVGKIVKEKSIDFIFPIHDDEIRTLADSEWAGCSMLPSTPSASIKLCTDKLAMAQTCTASGIRAPFTVSMTEYRNNPFFPAFCKPRRGVGSAGTKLVESVSDIASITQTTAELVVQQVCSGPEITVDVLHSTCGIVAIARERLEIKAGVATKCRVFYSPEFVKLASQLADIFGLTGLFCFQIIWNVDHWSVTDINPRTGGATAMTTAAGINLYKEYFLARAIGEEWSRFQGLKRQMLTLEEVFVTRYFEEHVSRV